MGAGSQREYMLPLIPLPTGIALQGVSRREGRAPADEEASSSRRRVSVHLMLPPASQVQHGSSPSWLSYAYLRRQQDHSHVDGKRAFEHPWLTNSSCIRVSVR